MADIPLLPPGREVELPGRGTTFVREAAGPPGAPTVLLLHGWTATADLNWFRCYGPLARSFRVVALDHRGHGRGIRSSTPFRLEDCADDAAALCEVLGVRRAIAVGYSMGGPVAMLTWRRHPELVAGLVLGATAGGFSATAEERRNFLGLAGLAALARVTPPGARNWLAARMIEGRGKAPTPWVMRQVQRHDWTALLEAGADIGRFDSLAWVGQIDVPVAQLLTEDDHVVPLWRQEKLLAGLPAARSWRVHAHHDAVVAAPEQFIPALLEACTWVATEATWGGPAVRRGASTEPDGPPGGEDVGGEDVSGQAAGEHVDGQAAREDAGGQAADEDAGGQAAGDDAGGHSAGGKARRPEDPPPALPAGAP